MTPWQLSLSNWVSLTSVKYVKVTQTSDLERFNALYFNYEQILDIIKTHGGKKGKQALQTTYFLQS